jgi:SNF2 family DNA or RNA helicase
LHFDRQRLLSYQRRVTSQYGAEFTDERRPEWLKIDRIIACRKQDTNAGTPSALKGKATEVPDDDRSPLEYLVKWCNLDYNGSTWEEESGDQDMLDAIQKFSERHLIAKKRELSEQTGRDVAIGILQQPVYIKGGFLHEYQIEGLKWLVANFEEQKSVILADEMGLGKTIQAISFMMCLRHEKLSSKPFLVITPKSTLPGWEQELQQWGADLNAVVYEGDQTARALIREYEFYTADEAPLFDVLVTSYDLSMRDNSCLQRFEWSCIIG